MLDLMYVFLGSVVVSIVTVWLYRSGLSFGKAVNFELEKPRARIHAKPRTPKHRGARPLHQRKQSTYQGEYKTPWGW